MKSFMMILGLALLAGCTAGPYYSASRPEVSPQLTVQAQASIDVNPDQIQLRLGVVTEAEAAGQALAENNRRMRAIMQMLEKNGLGPDELATGQFNIHPLWSRPPRPTPANWQRAIIGYQVNNDLLVTTSQLDKAGSLLSLAQQSGANQIGGLQFGLADRSAHRQEAIALAVAKARQKAQTMASAAGVSLGRLLSMSLDVGAENPPRVMLAEARTAPDAVPVVASKVAVTGAVTMVYQLVEGQPK